MCENASVNQRIQDFLFGKIFEVVSSEYDSMVLLFGTNHANALKKCFRIIFYYSALLWVGHTSGEF